MNINEAQKILKNAGYLLEDKYMDEMDKELDQTVTLNTILSGLQKEGYKISGIKNDSIYVWPVENKRYCVVININDRNFMYPYDFYCYVLDREERTRKMSWGYTVTKEDKCYYDPCMSSINCYTGPVKDICKPAEKKLNKLTQPGFFKRLFGNKNVQESYKNEIPDNVMELAEEVLNHSCYDLDWDVYTLAEMGEDWLKDYLRELNDKEMYRACM